MEHTREFKIMREKKDGQRVYKEKIDKDDDEVVNV